jgi:uncharacterized membrane protein
MTALRRRAPDLLALLFAGSAVLHIVSPHTYEQIVPSWIPLAREVIYVSGVAEMICAVGLFLRRPWAAPASVALLVIVFPANIQMAVDAGSHKLSGLFDSRTIAYLRLPLQLPLIWAALQARRSRRVAAPLSGGHERL